MIRFNLASVSLMVRLAVAFDSLQSRFGFALSGPIYDVDEAVEEEDNETVEEEETVDVNETVIALKSNKKRRADKNPHPFLKVKIKKSGND